MTDETTDADREELIARLRMYSSTDNHHSWRSICERQAAEALAAQSAEIERLKVENERLSKAVVSGILQDLLNEGGIEALVDFIKHIHQSALLSRKGDEQ